MTHLLPTPPRSPRDVPVHLALLVVAAALLLAPVRAVTAQDALDGELRTAMAAAAPGERLAVSLVMADRLAPRELATLAPSATPRQRRALVAARLREHAASSQAGVRALLDAAVADGRARLRSVLWMGNALLFEAEAPVLAGLAAAPGVERLRLLSDIPTERQQDVMPVATSAPTPPLLAAPPPAVEPNLVALQAPLLWDKGIDGSGVLIGTIDSGVDITHPDLAGHIYTNPGEIAGNGLDDDGNGFVDDLHGWDFFHGNADVTSTDPHGTKTAGLMVGDGTGGQLTGMAPGASLVVCEVDSEAQYWEAQQYLLDVGVDVVSSSYSYKWPDRPDYHMFRTLCDVELAAGIVHANSIGNQGNQQFLYPIPFNVSTPGNVPSPFAHPGDVAGGHSSVLGCGGIFSDDSTYFASGRGPSAWEDLALYDPAWSQPQDSAYWDYPFGGFGGAGPGLLKPDLVTYTATVNTTSLGGGYTAFSGTSASTPQLGGALALLRQLQPAALPRHLAGALQLSAVDLGAPGKDEVFGAGKVAVFAAARRLVVLGVFEPNDVALGVPFDLQLYGTPSHLVYGFYNAPLVTGFGEWNLPPGFFFMDAFLLDGAGRATVPYVVPNDPILAGVTVWFQFGEEAPDFSWGAGPWLSVPEPLVIAP
jgi:subtilisin family serine protease